MTHFQKHRDCECRFGERERGTCPDCVGRGAITTGKRKRRKTAMCQPCQGFGRVCLKCGGYVPRVFGPDA